MAGSGMAVLPACSRANHAAGADTRDADLVVHNAVVYTVDSRVPRAEAFAVKGDRFVAVGSNSDILGLVGKGTQTYDARHMTITPGFMDCHNHAPGAELLYEVIVGNPFSVEFVTIASILDKLRARAKQTPPGYWVRGYFYDEGKIKDDRFLNVHDLDQVSTVHPIEVVTRGGHASVLNSKAFALAHVNRDTPNPFGGYYDRFPNGDLNGRASDLARRVFANVGKRQTFTEQEKLQRDRDGLVYISKQFVRVGLTSVHHEGGNLEALQQLRARGELLHRVCYESNGAALDAMISAGLMSGFGDEWIRLGPTSEHLVDGSLQDRTCWLSTPYIGITPPYRGNLVTTQKDLDDWVERAWRAGIRPNCHANGDGAIDMYLKSLERCQRLFPRTDFRPKITHCALITDDLLKRIKALDAVPVPFTTYLYYNSDKFKYYGEEMMKRCLAFRSMLDAGIAVAVGTDFPPGPFDPRMGIQGMVTRTGYDGKTWGANQRISGEEALRISTLNGAYNSHEEKIKGSITPGKLADFVVLADDLLRVDPEKIKDIQVVRTVVGGSTVYQA
jgi:hypothetical protein